MEGNSVHLKCKIFYSFTERDINDWLGTQDVEWIKFIKQSVFNNRLVISIFYI